MPGIELNLPIPSLSDTQTQVVTKTAQALTAIDADLAAPVLPSEININTALPFNGNAATNVGYITFGGGTPGGTIPGAIYYNNGEWFVVDSTGTIQITNGGQLNVAVNGGIGGDYIAVSALLSYNSAGSKYIFFGAGGSTIVDVDVRKVILEGTSATVTLGVDASLVANKVVNFKSLPTSGVGLVAYDSAATAIVDGSTVAITAATTFNGLVTLNGGYIGPNHGSFTKEVPFTLGPGVTTANINTFDLITSTAAVWMWHSEPLDVAVGDKITTVLARVVKPTGVTTITVALKKRNSLTGAITTIQTSSTPTGAGTYDVTISIGSPTAVAVRERWYIEVTGDGASGFGTGEQIGGLSYTWTA